MVLTLTFMAGAFQLALGLARLGALVNFISHSVVVGFTAGAALLIATSQVSTFLGIPGTKQHAFIHIWETLPASAARPIPTVLAVSAVTLVTAVAFKIFLPRFPGLLLAMIAGSVTARGAPRGGARRAARRFAAGAPAAAVVAGPLDGRGAQPGAGRAGHRPARAGRGGLDRPLGGDALAPAHRQQPGVHRAGALERGRQLLLELRILRSFTRSGLNFAVGAQTPMAAVYAALSLGAVLLLIAPLTAFLPMAAMAAVLLVVAAGLVDVHHIRMIAKTSRPEAVVLLVTLVTTLVAELEFAIYVGVILSLVLYLNRTSHPSFITLVPDPETSAAGS